MWRKMITYYGVYSNPKVPDDITVHSLHPLPKHRTFRAAGGNRRFKRIKYKQYTRKVIIVAKSAKVKKKARDLDDEDLEDLEELEDLDDLDEDEDDEEPEDEDEEDDDEEDEDEEDDGLDDLPVKELRAKARKDGHAPSDIRGKNKGALVELIRAGVEEDDEDDEEDDEDDDVEEDDVEEDDEDDEEETPPKRGKKSSSKKSSSKTKKDNSGPSRSRTTDGKVGVQEVAEAAGTDARKLRLVLRKHGIEKDEDVGRYEWPSLKNKEVLKIIKLVKGGAVKAAQKESLDNLKASKGRKKTTSTKKTTDAPRKKTKASGTTAAKKKRRKSA